MLSKGNDPDRWQRLLDSLDEKLQLGLLDQLRKVQSYHFEGNSLFLEGFSKEQCEYLSRPVVLQQLQFLAQDAIGIQEVHLKPATANPDKQQE